MANCLRNILSIEVKFFKILCAEGSSSSSYLIKSPGKETWSLPVSKESELSFLVIKRTFKSKSESKPNTTQSTDIFILDIQEAKTHYQQVIKLATNTN